MVMGGMARNGGVKVKLAGLARRGRGGSCHREAGTGAKKNPGGCTCRGFGNGIHQPRARHTGLPARGRLALVMMMVMAENHGIEGRLDGAGIRAVQVLFCGAGAAPAQPDVS